MEEFEEQSNTKKYAIVGIIAVLVLALLAVGFYLIRKRSLDGGKEISSANQNSSQPNTSGGQAEPPVTDLVPSMTNAPAEAVAVESPVIPPMPIDPTTNRLLTDEEKAEHRFPLDWTVRVQAFKTAAGSVYLDYKVESKPSDQDHDRLSDVDEIKWKTDPKKPDTDGDGIMDGDEVYIYHTDPTKADDLFSNDKK